MLGPAKIHFTKRHSNDPIYFVRRTDRTSNFGQR